MKFCPDYNPCNALESIAGTLNSLLSGLLTKLFKLFENGRLQACASRFDGSRLAR